MQTRQKLFIAGSLVVIGLGVLTFVFILMSSLNASPDSPVGQKSSPGATTTATHHAPATPAITPLHPDPQAGWVKAPAIAEAKAIAFSLSAPLTGYVCTNSTHVTDIYKATSSPLFIRATHDGGRTWSAPLSTGISTISCKLTINPDNPNDVIFNRIDCLFCDALIGSPYRSLDGGKTWAQVNLPSGPSQNGHITQFAFDGTTMYVTVDYYPGDYKSNPQLPLVAVSVNGQPLQWTNTTAFYANSRPNAVSGTLGIFAYHATLIVVRQVPNASAGIEAGFFLLRSTDMGQSWAQFTDDSLKQIVPQTIVPLGDGKTLFGKGYLLSAQSFTSIDGGMTWNLVQLPTLNDGSDPGQRPLFLVPDGSYYMQTAKYTAAGTHSTVAYSIYHWSPGDAQWTPISTNGQLPLSIVSAMTSGHANALWKADSSTSKDPLAPDGFYFHAP